MSRPSIRQVQDQPLSGIFSTACGGIVLLIRSHTPDYVALRSPVDNTFREVPSILNPDAPIGQNSFYSLGFDPVINEYKIVLVKAELDGPGLNVYVCTLGPNAWTRHLELAIQCHPLVKPATFIKDTLYFHGMDMTTITNFVVAFNLSSESFQQINLPDDIDVLSLGVLTNEVCFLSAPLHNFNKVWADTDDGWIRRYIIPNQISFSLRCEKLLWVDKNQSILLTSEVVFNSTDGNVTPITLPNARKHGFHNVRLCTYLPSYMEYNLLI